MLDFSAELDRLRPRLGDRVTDALVARERREVFSVYPEVRIAAWVGALLIAAAVGLFVKNNFELFDRVFLAAVLGAMAMACYVWAWRGGRLSTAAAELPLSNAAASPPQARAVAALPQSRVVNEYVLLLGALLLSADAGFIEQQFDVFGAHGPRHFLLLALVHGVTAYGFNSRLVLSLSIASLAAWMGIERNASFGTELAVRAFACAAVVLVWRAIHVRWSAVALPPLSDAAEPRSARFESGSRAAALHSFPRVFEHAAANLALWGGLLLLDEAPAMAALITTTIAALVMAWGFRTRVESFVLYAFVYAVIADVGYAMTLIDEELAVLAGMLIAIPTLVFIHRRFRRGES